MAVRTVAHHVGMSCKDPLAIERFYARHFGFRRVRVVPIGAEQVVFLRAGDFYLELFQAKQDAPAPPAGGAGPEYPSFRHLAFAVDDVDAKIAEMGADARVTLGPFGFDDWIQGWRGAWVSDPEGNVVELAQGYRDQDDPPPAPA